MNTPSDGTPDFLHVHPVVGDSPSDEQVIVPAGQGNCLALADVELMVQIVAKASEPALSGDLLKRKHRLLSSCGELIGSERWLWLRGALRGQNPQNAGLAAVLHGGWAETRQCRQVAALLLRSNPQLGLLERVSQALMEARSLTCLRVDLADGPAWQEIVPAWHALEVDDFVVSFKPLDAESFSGVAFFRHADQPPFTVRERMLVSVMTQQISWLHRREVGAFGERRSLGLGPRPRQVLIYLLAGESNKTVAERMGISEHTVGDYVKRIYRHFGVKSRGELFALLISGGLHAG